MCEYLSKAEISIYKDKKTKNRSMCVKIIKKP